MSAGKEKSHRAWKVMIGCCFLVAVGFALPMTCMSLLIKPISQSLGIGVAGLMAYFSVLGLGGIILAPVAPRMLKKYNARTMIRVGLVISALILVAMSFATAAYMFVIGGFIMGLLQPFVSVLACTFIINNWFKEQVGFALGIVMASIGIGGAVFSPLTSKVMALWGWQAALYFLAAALFGIGGVAASVLRFHPGEVGLQPYGADHASAQGGMNAPTSAELPGVTLKEAVRLPAFYILAFGFILFGYIASLNVSIATLVASIGYDAVVVGSVIAVLAIGTLIGKICIGWIRDKVGGSWPTFTGLFISALSMVIFIADIKNPSLPLTYAAGFLGGFGLALGTILPPLVTGEVFGRKDFGPLFGVTAIFPVIGMAIGSPLMGAMYDHTKTFAGVCVSIIVVCILAFPVAALAIKYGRKAWAQQ